MIEVIPFLYEDIDELKANTYLIKDNKKKCVVVDPGVDNDKLGDYIQRNKLQLEAILLTHTHVDHMRGIDRLVDRFKCDLYVGFDDEIGLTDEEYNCASELDERLVIRAKAKTVADNEVLKILNEDIKVIYTPFHTRGSVCYYLSNSGLLFTGDTLFKMVIGRTDLKSSCRGTIRESLAKLRVLPDEVKIYPGHGDFTTMGFEKVKNLFLNR